MSVLFHVKRLPRKMFEPYDIIVVGAGHAGCEAAAAAAALGSRVLLITMNLQVIGQMSCNPAMGGVGKGQIIREIDALGGWSGVVADQSAIQFRMLNRSKGPAMWSPRTQNDRMRFAELWRLKLEEIENVHFLQDMVSGLIVEGERVAGVSTQMGYQIRARAVVLTNGTFLNGTIHIGEKQFGGGRMAERAATGITEQLKSLGFESGRMKTGTPPRVDGRSLDYSKMEEHKGDEHPEKFSYLGSIQPLTQQRSCYMTYTSPAVHDTLREGFAQSPMYAGRIQGLGPRYCPSIEDKIDRFADKDRHQIMVEPEGWSTVEVYVNGFSTSLPDEVQYRALRQMAGFENARVFRPGYAIEYDYFPPLQLRHTLETKLVGGLYFAGQINGTTGYEEAAAQGLMAGINAHLGITQQPAFILRRSEAYIGVLIDDLITKGTEEPYRMFTSRAEYRILLRQDNADLRLTEKSHTLGLASDARMKRVEEKSSAIKSITKAIDGLSVEPEQVNPSLAEMGQSETEQKVKASSILGRPKITLDMLKDWVPSINEAISGFDSESQEEAEIEIKYRGYIQKEHEQAEKQSRLEGVALSDSLDFRAMRALSKEAQEKLSRVRPATIGQASRISGVTPADVSVLLVHLGR